MLYYLQEILTWIKWSKTFDSRVLLELGGSHMNTGSHSILVISLILWDPSTLCYIIERVTFIDLLLVQNILNFKYIFRLWWATSNHNARDSPPQQEVGRGQRRLHCARLLADHQPPGLAHHPHPRHHHHLHCAGCSGVRQWGENNDKYSV